MSRREAEDLWIKYKEGTATLEEIAIIESWLLNYVEYAEVIPNEEELIDADKNIGAGLIYRTSKSKSSLFLSIVASAAAIVILFGVWSLLFVQKKTIVESDNDVLPGTNRAILTLSNGKAIDLSDVKTGITIDDATISYNDGTAISNNSSDNFSGQITISVPKGGEYQITLPDGSKVWLNAATTLTFGSSLSENEDGDRSVKLRGEAYFEVFKNKKRPFIVETVQQKIKVLGTHFNINTYQNLNNITTLIEGSVKIISENNEQTLLLKPGQQSDYSGRKLQAKSVDIELYTAWKNGKLQFENADLKTVMEMVSRWYNVDVTYQNYPYESKFTGSISRSKNISEVLNILENTGEVHFKILGKEVIVMR